MKASEIAGRIKERPILFSGEMVRAILEGRKTQTRRVMRPQPFLTLLNPSETEKWWVLDRSEDGYGKANAAWKEGEEPFWTYCRHGQPGDRLWVRETLQHGSHNNPAPRHNHLWRYAADNELVMVSEDRHTEMLVWATHKEGDVCVSIHMPRWASRINLEITKVCVERVQEISEADAAAEGVKFGSYAPGECRTVARGAYMDLWNKINAERGFGWESNPWVWVLEFKMLTTETGEVR